ncbi:E3 ubiquitin-protein ligase TRIM71-like [Mercenaria mercenaria]|uniref:E3 ubiquitin-protein ligase TRIM71-like n=1 Tax=Mercenaria mercenaria TaxID=6596 RepID=UPI00234EBF7E|nr:E3 ubiquitin-protein ligase TRIM71-like [Mercenaria mercenaria]
MEVSGRKEWKSSPSTRRKNKSDILCQPCQGEGENVQAEGYCETCNEFLCTSCLKVHRKLSATKNHVIKSKDEMPRMPNVTVQTDSCSELCATHKTEIVKFYCRGHDIVGCGDCMILYHKSCDVDFVSEISSNYNNREQMSEIKQNLEALEKEISYRRLEIKRNVKATGEMKNKIIKEIKQFREELNRYLDHAQEKLLKKVTELNDDNICLLNMFQSNCTSVETEINELKSKLSQNSDKMNQLFVTTKLAKKKMQLCMETLENVKSKYQTNYIKFEPSSELMYLIRKDLPLGILTKEKHTNLRILTRDIKKFTTQRQTCSSDTKAKFVKKVAAQGVNEGECYITGLAILPCDEILLADSHNLSLKILNIREQKIVSKYKIHSPPWDVTMIGRGKAAVTLPAIGRILFVNIENGETEGHSLKVRNRCFGIDHMNGLIAVSFCSPSAIQILNMKGHILHEVTKMFAWPSYIALSKDCKSMYVSDFHNQSVYELTIDGHLKNTYEGEYLYRPRGLAITNDGNIVVCCPDQNSTVSMIITKTGEILNFPVQHVQKPFTLLLCEDQNKMFICEYNRSADRNYVQIFDLR